MTMEISKLSIFVATAFILIITPGSAVLYIMAKGLEQGWKAGLVPPLYLSLILRLLVGVITVVAGVLTITRSWHPFSDPFSDIPHLLNGDVRQMASAAGFTCDDMLLEDQPAYALCTHNNPIYAGHFLRINTNVTNEIVFSPESANLRIGDLVLRWGEPEVWIYCGAVIASWPAHHILVAPAITPDKPLTYFALITSITFMQTEAADSTQPFKTDAVSYCGGIKESSLEKWGG